MWLIQHWYKPVLAAGICIGVEPKVSCSVPSGSLVTCSKNNVYLVKGKTLYKVQNGLDK